MSGGVSSPIGAYHATVSDPITTRPRARIAVISPHSSPLDQPGTGDAGGMNVYIRSVGRRLARRGVAVDAFTRCSGRGVPEVQEVESGFRVIQVHAGPCDPVARPDLPGLVPEFTRGVLAFHPGYDLVHGHYWLGGLAARTVAAEWGLPLVASFHTLARVKDLFADGDPPEPEERVRGEVAVVADALRILTPTPTEGDNLIRLYGASSEQVRVVTPGVDRTTFRPLPREPSRRALGVGPGPVIVFAGRLQRLKGPDVAIRSVARAVRADPEATRGLTLVMAGGPSGPGLGWSHPEEIRRFAEAEGVADRLVLHPPVPHDELPALLSAADVVLVPSRSESFGLVALEAQACGVPVVASDVGGLRHLVADGEGGFLVPVGDVEAFAERILRILRDPSLAVRLRRAALEQARRFDWDATTDRALAVYAELLPSLRDEPAGAGVPVQG